MKIQYKLAKDLAGVRKQVETAIKTANTMKKQVQVALISILAHAEKHGDYTQAQVLVDGLGHGVNGKAVVEFLTQFGGLIVDEENRCFGGWQGKEYIAARFQEAKATMWYDLKPVNPWQGYSLEDELLKVINRHTAMLKKLAKLPEDSEERAKFNLDVNEATLTNVVSICNFEAIVEEAAEAEAVAA